MRQNNAKMLKTEVFDNNLDDDELAECEDQRRPTSAGGGGGGRAGGTGAGSGHLTCLVCGDTATGRHYGSVACNGCKGFFRRTIRRAYKYSCRFNGNCHIDKHNRAVCRACRYARCIKFGMKIDAVQNERDLIGKRGRYASNSTGSPKSSPPNNASTSSHHQNSMDAFDPAVMATQNVAAAAVDADGTEAMDVFAQSTSSSAVDAPTSAPASSSAPMCSASSGASPQQQQQQSSATCTTTVKSRRISGSSGTKSYEFRKHYSHHAHGASSNTSSTDLGDGGDLWQSSQAILEFLMKSEEKIRRLRDSVIKETGKLEYTTKTEPARLIASNGRRATIKDIFHSLHSQLLLVIEWAKNLKPFAELNTEDQTALLKNFASQHIVLSVAYRSINASDSLKLINDSCIPRTTAADNDTDPFSDFYKKDCERVMDTLVAPMRFLKMDDVEFVALKACILFNPVARGLSNESVLKVLDTRRKIFAALEFYTAQKVPRQLHRIGDLTFFILSPLQCLAKSVSEDVLVTKLSGVARIDQLMEELILEDSEPKQFSSGQRQMNLNKSLSSSTEFTNDTKLSESVARSISTPSGPEDYYLLGDIDLSTAASGAAALAAQSAAANLFRGRTESAPSGLHATSPLVTSVGGGISAPSNLSPIHDFEMFSTLSSYVLGGPLQGPITSPSNDVLLSSSCALSEPATSPSPTVISTHQFHPVPSSAPTPNPLVMSATMVSPDAPPSHQQQLQQPQQQQQSSSSLRSVQMSAPQNSVYMREAGDFQGDESSGGMFSAANSNQQQPQLEQQPQHIQMMNVTGAVTAAQHSRVLQQQQQQLQAAQKQQHQLQTQTTIHLEHDHQYLQQQPPTQQHQQHLIQQQQQPQRPTIQQQLLLPSPQQQQQQFEQLVDVLSLRDSIHADAGTPTLADHMAAHQQQQQHHQQQQSVWVTGTAQPQPM